MLAVTPAAADAISALTAQDGISDQGGVRFSMRTTEDTQAALSLAVASAPVEGDEVVTASAGAKVFLETGPAAEFLSDKVLDVQQDTQGQLNFTVLERGEDA